MTAKVFFIFAIFGQGDSVSIAASPRLVRRACRDSGPIPGTPPGRYGTRGHEKDDAPPLKCSSSNAKLMVFEPLPDFGDRHGFLVEPAVGSADFLHDRARPSGSAFFNILTAPSPSSDDSGTSLLPTIMSPSQDVCWRMATGRLGWSPPGPVRSFVSGEEGMLFAGFFRYAALVQDGEVVYPLPGTGVRGFIRCNRICSLGLACIKCSAGQCAR